MTKNSVKYLCMTPMEQFKTLFGTISIFYYCIFLIFRWLWGLSLNSNLIHSNGILKNKKTLYLGVIKFNPIFPLRNRKRTWKMYYKNISITYQISEIFGIKKYLQFTFGAYKIDNNRFHHVTHLWHFLMWDLSDKSQLSKNSRCKKRRF